MKTKERIGSCDVELISPSYSSDEATLEASAIPFYVMESLTFSSNLFPQGSEMEEDRLTPRVLTPTDEVSSDSGESSADDSDWEDIEEDDDDDDVCIMFENEDDDFGSRMRKNCISRFSAVTGSCLKSNGYRNVPKINGFLRISVKGHFPSHGPHHQSQSSQCWLSRLSQGCSKRAKMTPVFKKVRFDDNELVQVREFEDDEDSKQSRKKYWEIFAIDRARFRERVYRVEQAIGGIIFDKDRRDKVHADLVEFHRQQPQSVDILNTDNNPSKTDDITTNRCNKRFRNKRNKNGIWGSSSFHAFEILVLILLLVIATNNSVIGNSDPLY